MGTAGTDWGSPSPPHRLARRGASPSWRRSVPFWAVSTVVSSGGGGPGRRFFFFLLLFLPSKGPGASFVGFVSLVGFETLKQDPFTTGWFTTPARALCSYLCTCKCI